MTDPIQTPAPVEEPHMRPRGGCDYAGHEFGAPYPDSMCVDGYLWDADSCDEPGGPLTRGGDIPCPQCNAEAHAEYYREE